MKDNRGSAQTLVVGSLLLLSLAVSLILYAQVVVFPELNQRSEISQLEDSTQSMKDIKTKVSTVSSSGGSVSVLFNNRISYPFQPASPSDQFGQVNIRGDDKINIRFARFSSSNPISSDDHNIVSYNPRLIELQTEGRSSVYDNGIVGVTEPGQAGYTTLSSQNIIKGDNVNIVHLVSDKDSGFKSSNPVISFTKIDGASTTMSGDGVKDIQIEFRSQYSKSVWDSQLSDEPNVEGVDVSGSKVTIFLDGTENYNLKYSRILVS